MHRLPLAARAGYPGRMEAEGPTALIGAYEPGPGGLRALLPLAGATLAEQQARRAVAAGAAGVLLLVEEVPPELAAAVARLRHDGIAVALAQGIDHAADALLDRTVLLIADGCLPDAALLATLAAAPVPTLATLADGPAHIACERIDADTRWAGVALLDGRRVGETAAMLGSWDPVSTLLRRAVQEGAGRVPADAMPPLLLARAADADAAEAAIVAAARRRSADWVARAFAPIEERLLPGLLARRIGAAWLGALAAALALLGAGGAWAGWRWPALIALLLGVPVFLLAERLARVQARQLPLGRLIPLLRTIGAMLAVLGLAHALAEQSGQWGWWLVGALLPVTMLTLRAAYRLTGAARPLWAASGDALVWTMLPFAMWGRWDVGLAALLAYAAVSFGVMQRRALVQVGGVPLASSARPAR